MKLRENNLRMTQKYYEIQAVNGDKAILYTVLLDRQPHESNVKVCAALKRPQKLNSWKSRGHMP